MQTHMKQNICRIYKKGTSHRNASNNREGGIGREIATDVATGVAVGGVLETAFGHNYLSNFLS